MDINKMKSVLAVAQTHSFSEAAAELPLAQSSVSKHIASVEDELGITLFTRSRNSKSVELTGDGEIFVKYAREIVDDYDAMCRDLQAAGQKTTLVVRTIPMPGVFSRSELLSHFLGRDSNIELKLETKKSREVLPALLNKQIDAAVFRPFFENGVVLSPDSLLYDARLDVFEICDNPALIAVAPNHPLADRDSLELIDLIGEKIIVQRPDKPVSSHDAIRCDLFIRTCINAGFEPQILPTVDPDGREGKVQLNLAALGKCVMLINVKMPKELHGIKLIPLHGLPWQAKTAVAALKGHKRKAIETLVSCLREMSQ